MYLDEMAVELYHATSSGDRAWATTDIPGVFSMRQGEFIIQSGFEPMTPRPRYYMRVFGRNGKLLHQLLDEPEQLQLKEAGKLYESILRSQEKNKNLSLVAKLDIADSPRQRQRDTNRSLFDMRGE